MVKLIWDRINSHRYTARFDDFHYVCTKSDYQAKLGRNPWSAYRYYQDASTLAGHNLAYCVLLFEAKAACLADIKAVMG
ncbi:MAG: hypothetical protein FWG40_00830 [Peptococcaceae bacterium]|nr:hypothetical protein [Peptococcaceae bacterium]